MNKRVFYGMTAVALFSVSLGGQAQNLAKEKAVLIDDARVVLSLSPQERAAVLLEMRQFLQSTQQIIGGIVADDMNAVVSAARASGVSAQKGAPRSLANKLPEAFRTLGFDTHRQFDGLALDAEQLGDGEHALSQLHRLLGNCVSCHSAYQISGP